MGFFKNTSNKSICNKDITPWKSKEINDDIVYCILSIKTTGTNRFVDEIMSISIIKYQNDQIIDKFYSLIKVKKLVAPTISSITKINNKTLTKQGTELVYVLPEVLKFIGDSFLISHNAWDFEIPFLNHKLKKHNLKPISTHVVDTQRLSEELFVDKRLKHDLLSVSKRMKINVNRVKDLTSEYHVEVLLEVWKKFLIYFYTRKMTAYKWAIKIQY